ncbi:MAG TPA: hypothetical protein VNI83_07155, partial [Vicinamibacterales bacterium]|nr:hypothetical protein [Vicinamibacterales bacterium]
MRPETPVGALGARLDPARGFQRRALRRDGPHEGQIVGPRPEGEDVVVARSGARPLTGLSLESGQRDLREHPVGREPVVEGRGTLLDHTRPFGGGRLPVAQRRQRAREAGRGRQLRIGGRGGEKAVEG